MIQRDASQKVDNGRSLTPKEGLIVTGKLTRFEATSNAKRRHTEDEKKTQGEG